MKTQECDPHDCPCQTKTCTCYSLGTLEGGTIDQNSLAVTDIGNTNTGMGCEKAWSPMECESYQAFLAATGCDPKTTNCILLYKEGGQVPPSATAQQGCGGAGQPACPPAGATTCSITPATKPPDPCATGDAFGCGSKVGNYVSKAYKDSCWGCGTVAKVAGFVGAVGYVWMGRGKELAGDY